MTPDLIDELNGLLVQATRERSHFYTGRVIMLSIQEIRHLRQALQEIRDGDELTGAECMAIATRALSGGIHGAATK